jgi:hypothetical protein
MLRFARLAWFLGIALIAPLSHATLITYQAGLSGANEVPPNGSLATGFANVVVDTAFQLLTVDET